MSYLFKVFTSQRNLIKMPTLKRISPSEILFTHDTINGKFNDGRGLDELVQDLRRHGHKPDEVLKDCAIKVVRRADGQYSMNNRRLYAMRMAIPDKPVLCIVYDGVEDFIQCNNSRGR